MYCIKCNKYWKFLNSKISYTFNKTLVLAIICNKCDNNDDVMFKKHESIQTLIILEFIVNLKK